MWAEVVLCVEGEWHREPLEYLGPPPVSTLFLFQVAYEEPAEDADEGPEDGELRGERGEGRHQGHRERPDQGGAKEAERE